MRRLAWIVFTTVLLAGCYGGHGGYGYGPSVSLYHAAPTYYGPAWHVFPRHVHPPRRHHDAKRHHHVRDRDHARNPRLHGRGADRKHWRHGGHRDGRDWAGRRGQGWGR